MDKVDFIAVYLREAHPQDGWAYGPGTVGPKILQPRDYEARTQVAATCCAALKMTLPLVVDDMEDSVGHAYSGMPDRLYIVDRHGKIAYKGGRGPFGFKPAEMEQTLMLLQLEEGNIRPAAATSSPPRPQP